MIFVRSTELKILQIDLFYTHIFCHRFGTYYNNYLSICRILERSHLKNYCCWFRKDTTANVTSELVKSPKVNTTDLGILFFNI